MSLDNVIGSAATGGAAIGGAGTAPPPSTSAPGQAVGGAALGAGAPGILSATTPIPIGAYIVGGFVLVALSDTQVAPVIAAFLTAAIIYNGIKILGSGQGASITSTARNAVTPSSPTLA